MRLSLAPLALAAVLAAGPSQAQKLPPDPKPIGLPPDPQPIGEPSAPKPFGLPDTPEPIQKAAPPRTSGQPTASMPMGNPVTMGITLPDILAVEMPRGASEIGPEYPPLRQLLASAHAEGQVTHDLHRKVGVGPVRVTWSWWQGAPGAGRPVASRSERVFILPYGMTPVGVSGDENATAANNGAHIARDSSGRVHMVWQDSGRPGARTGAVYRRAAVAADGSVHFETDPVYISDGGPNDWNAYPALAVSGGNVQIVWQSGGTARTRRVSPGPGGWVMGPAIDTGARSEGRDIGDSIAFDDKGGLHITTPNGVYAWSVDGGRSWHADAIPLPPRTRIKTQSITVDPAGVVHIAFSAPVDRSASLGGYWQLRTIDRTPAGAWINPTDVLAGMPGWTETGDGGDVMADWANIVADRRGALHLTWHGTAKSHKFAKDLAYYTWKKPGGSWQPPLLLPMPGSDVKLSYAPSMALDSDRVLAMVFHDSSGAVGEQAGFDTSLEVLKDGQSVAPVIPVEQFLRTALAAHRPETGMGFRFPSLAPTVWHGPNGAATLDILEPVLSKFDPPGPNIIVYQRLDLDGRLH